MRFWKVTLVLGALLVVMTPARSDAWFGFLDRLSGPGPFYGALYDVRVACLGRPFTVPDDLELALTKASFQSALVRPGGDNLKIATDAWSEFLNAVDKANSDFPVLSDSDIRILRTRVTSLDSAAFEEFNRQMIPRPPQSTPLLPIGRLADAMRLGAAAIDKMYRANVSLNSTGVLVSLCSPHSTRRLALDVAGDFWQANSNTNFANDYTIRLITVLPGLSFRVFDDPRYDFVDIGAGAGMYWFSSRAFDRFNGLVAQPIRFDFRGPSRWANAGGLKQLAAFVTARFGFTVFTGGFAADAFAAEGDNARPIGAEWTKTGAIYINLTPLLRRPKHILPIP